VRKVSLIFISTVLLMILIISGCSHENKQSEVKTAETVKAAIYKVQKQQKEDIYEISGTVVSRNPVKVVSKVMGTVADINFEEGKQVKKGELLLTIDAPDIKANLERANSAVLEAEKAVEVAKTNAKHAENTFKRYEKLYQEKAISLQEFEGIESRKNVALDEVKRAESVLEQAKAEKSRANAAYSYTKVYAPVNGVITEKIASVGLNVMPGSPLFTIETDTNLRIEVNADEKVLPIVKKGQRLTVYFDVLKKETTGVVSEIVPSIDPVSRTFKLKLDLPSDKSIKLGFYGTVKFSLGMKEVITVPESSVINRGQLSYVYVVGNDNLASLRLIKVGDIKNGYVEVQSGLNEGEKIVKDAVLAKDGAKIIGE